jgi:hypothetical protein
MQDYQIIVLGKIMAEFVRALGMNAENKQRELLGNSMAYNCGDFESCAGNIESYVEQLR